ncbi:MAG TPA: hypothetical protein V6D06_18900 [Trichocoleus sp.]
MSDLLQLGNTASVDKGDSTSAYRDEDVIARHDVLSVCIAQVLRAAVLSARLLAENSVAEGEIATICTTARASSIGLLSHHRWESCWKFANR